MVHHNMYYVVTKLIAKKSVDNHNIPSNNMFSLLFDIANIISHDDD